MVIEFSLFELTSQKVDLGAILKSDEGTVTSVSTFDVSPASLS